MSFSTLIVCLKYFLKYTRDSHGCDHMVVGFTLQSVPITTSIVSSNPAHGRVCSMQHYVI